MKASPEGWAELQRLSTTGIATIVGTCDRQGVPEMTRAWGFRASDDGEVVAVAVYAGIGRRVLANLAENPYIAVTVVSPSTYRSFQVKGRVSRVAPASGDERQRVASHQRAFVEEVAAVGLPSEAAVRFFEREQQDCPDLMTIVVDVEAVFDQTPGPGAGGRV